MRKKEVKQTKEAARIKGEFYIWLTGAALTSCLIMLAGLLLLIAVNGLSSFWPSRVALLKKHDGTAVIGEIIERYFSDSEQQERLKVKRGNRDRYGLDFVWINNDDVATISYPQEVFVFERLEWGNLYAIPKELDSDALAELAEISFEDALQMAVRNSLALRERIRSFERKNLIPIAERQRRLELRLRSRAMQTAAPEIIESLKEEREKLRAEFQNINAETIAMRSALTGAVMVEDAEGAGFSVPLARITRAYQPNALGLLERLSMYLSNVILFLTSEPREANTEGGVFPALFGTAVLVLVMSVVVTPFGVVAAVYLYEYAKPGLMVSLIRVAVKNLAGVPSIVYGVFGLGFFIYGIGSSIDQFFFSDRLPNPTFGTGGLLWASLTLALLTLPTVIVATEEGLSAIPKNWREGSYALGATKFETIARVVLPALAPSILTGVILAVARGAGEVAPLMITGVVKLAPALPIDASFPFFHLERKFMHLGFHIYDLGFQSPNVDASRPTVYATALLLILLVVVLNFAAIMTRNKLRKLHRASAV